MHMKQCMAKHVPWSSLKVRGETALSRWFGLVTPRERESLAYDQAMEPAAFRGVDIGQSMGRTTHTAVVKDHEGGDVVIAPTVLPNSRLWFCFDAGSSQGGPREERFITPRELLMIQGWPMGGRPLEICKTCADALQADLAGNMFLEP